MQSKSGKRELLQGAAHGSMAELNRRVESIKSELAIGTKKPHRSCICAAPFALSLSNTPNQQCWRVRLALAGMNFLQFVKRLGFRSHWATVSPPSELLHRPVLALHGLEHAYHRATRILCCPKMSLWFITDVIIQASNRSNLAHQRERFQCRFDFFSMNPSGKEPVENAWKGVANSKTTWKLIG